MTSPTLSGSIRGYASSLSSGKDIIVEYESAVTLIIKVEESDAFSKAGQVIDFAKKQGYSIDSVSAYTEPYEAINAVHVLNIVFMSKKAP